MKKTHVYVCPSCRERKLQAEVKGGNCTVRCQGCAFAKKMPELEFNLEIHGKDEIILQRRKAALEGAARTVSSAFGINVVIVPPKPKKGRLKGSQ